jgi:protein TonB
MPSLSFVRSLLVALAIELALLLCAFALIVQLRPINDAPVEKSLELFFDEPKPPVEEPKPKQEPKLIERITPVRQTPSPRIVTPRIEPPPVIEKIPEAQSPVAEPVVPPSPPTPPVATVVDDTAQREANFAARLKAAIQAAVAYPFAARNMGYQGQARVEFMFRDGVSSQVHIVQSSGSGMIDQAAIAAVANAPVPLLPDSLKGKSMTYQVTVVFRLNAAR